MLGEVSHGLCRNANHSPLLKDTIALGSHGRKDKEVRFKDMEIEHSAVLSLFLALIATGELVWPSNGTFGFALTYCALGRFMHKYNAERPLKLLRSCIAYDLALQRMPPFYVLMIAANEDNVELSIAAFKQRYKVSLSEGEDPSMTPSLLSLTPEPYIGDGCWPLQVLQSLPAEYLWACWKAWSVAWASLYAKETGSHRTPSDIASEYEKAIKTVRPLPTVPRY